MPETIMRTVVNVEYDANGVRWDTLCCGHRIIPPRRGTDGYTSAQQRRCYVCAEALEEGADRDNDR